MLISARYLVCVLPIAQPNNASPTIQPQPTIQCDMFFGDNEFTEIDGEFIEYCLEHNDNKDTVFRRPRSMISGGEIIPGIVRWSVDDKYGHSIVVKYKGAYYENIDPIWPDSVDHDEPEFAIGDKVMAHGERGTILSYVRGGSYLVQLRNGTRINAHIRGMM